MIAVKILCACGQKIAFDVEPVHGRMPTALQCPVCGADATAPANAAIAQTLGTATSAGPAFAPAIEAAPPPLPVNLQPPSAPTFAPPPPPSRVSTPGVPRMPVVQPLARGVPPKPKSQVAKDGWSKPETGFHKLGTYIVMVPPIMVAMLPWARMGVELPPVAVWIVLAVFGIGGGIINLWGRGPLVAGAAIGVTIALGSYAAMTWWMHGKIFVRKYELIIAFVVGAVPGMLLQVAIQKIMKKRAQAAV